MQIEDVVLFINPDGWGEASVWNNDKRKYVLYFVHISWGNHVHFIFVNKYINVTSSIWSHS